MLTPADIEFIVANEGADVTRLLLAGSGKGKKGATGSSLEGVNLPLCAKCIQAREKMKVKAPLWYAKPSLAYPFAVSVEQGSSQATALFKQSIIAELLQENSGSAGKQAAGGLSGRNIVTADLTGGMGIDSFFISQVASRHYYFERNAELCAATEYNFRQLGADNIVVSGQDITDNNCAALRELEEKGVSLLYIDPARRTASGGKAILLQDYEPNVIELQEKMFAISRHILVKVSPMADIKLNLRHLPHTATVYIVAVGNECKELLFLLDRETINNDVNIISISLDTNGLKNELRFRLKEEEAAEATYATELGKFLYEPGKAILKGGAYKLISQRYGCRKLAVSTHLYTSDFLIDDFPGKVFMVEEVVPFNKKNLKEVASRFPKADLTARNFPMDTNALKKLSGIKDGGTRHIFAVTLCNGSKVLVVTSHFQLSEN